jgi:hypothetical protein
MRLVLAPVMAAVMAQQGSFYPSDVTPESPPLRAAIAGALAAP